MSLATLEKEIARELGIKRSQIMEWATHEIKAQEGEKLAYIKSLGVHVAYKETPSKKKKNEA